MSAGRRAFLTAGAALAGLAAPAAVRAEDRRTWRMTTAWPRDLPGPGVAAARLARRIGVLTGGRLTVRLFAAGELAPAFETLDVVATGGAEMGHAAGVFWAGKAAAAPLFTSAPYGLTPVEHLAWIEHGGGQAAWDALYAPLGVKPLLAGNTGATLGIWSKRAIGGLDDVKGLRMRIAGLGAETLRALGVAPVSVPPAEIFAALTSGVVDSAEFAGAAADRALGFGKTGAICYGPAFHEPNGAAEALFNAAAWEALPPDLRAAVETACREAHAASLAEAEWANAAALSALQKEGVRFAPWPADVLTAARPAAEAALDAVSAADRASQDVVESFRAARAHLSPSADWSAAPFLAARG